MILVLALACENPDAGAEVAPFENDVMRSVPLSGGTLARSAALGLVVAADPEGDRLVVSDLEDTFELPLGDNARPFRIAVDGAVAWVTLRGTGELVRVNLDRQRIRWRVPVCPEPRGVDFVDESLVVACATGQVVEVSRDGRILQTRTLEPDLRDVVATDAGVFVSRFRDRRILRLDPDDLTIASTLWLPRNATNVWRMLPDPDGGVSTVYEEAEEGPISEQTQGGYGGGGEPCGSLHQPRLARIVDHQVLLGAKLHGVVLPVDFAFTPDGELAVVSAGRDEVALFDLEWARLESDCAVPQHAVYTGFSTTGLPSAVVPHDDGIVIQTFGAPTLISWGSHVTGVRWRSDAVLSDDAPVAVFHRDPNHAAIACASCHPEGLDDDHVWDVDVPDSGAAVPGLKRTLSLTGGISERAPFHWHGELADEGALMHSTYVSRMGAEAPHEQTVSDLFAWLDGLRPIPGTSTHPRLEASGETLFRDVGCASCHAGPAFTDGELHEIHLDLPPIKTPSLLGVGARDALMHDGCARTLEERFTGRVTCTGGDRHGPISTLSEDDIDALVAYLKTL